MEAKKTAPKTVKTVKVTTQPEVEASLPTVGPNPDWCRVFPVDGTPFDEAGTVSNKKSDDVVNDGVPQREGEPQINPNLQEKQPVDVENPILERGLQKGEEESLPVKTIIDRTGTDDAPAG